MALFNRLGEEPLAWWDDSLYAQVARETAASSNWLIPTWQGAAWYHKPPLQLWATALAYRLFGFSELSSRLPSALLAPVALLAVFGIALELGGIVAAVAATIILLTTPHFFHFARRLMLDAPLTAFLATSLYCFLRGFDEPKFRLCAGIAWGLALMTKGAAALPLLAALGLYLLGAKTIPRRVKWASLAAMGWGILLAGVWHIYMVIVAGPDFLREYFDYHVWQRAVTVELGHSGGPTYYLGVIYAHSGLWSWLFVLGVVFAVLRVARDPHRRESLLLFWVLTWLVVYTLAQTKFEHYILPVYPALAVLGGCALGWLVQRRRATVPVLLAAFAVAGWQMTRHDFFDDPTNTQGLNAEIRELAHLVTRRSPTGATLYSFDVHWGLPQLYSGKHVVYLCPDPKFVQAYYDYPGTKRIGHELIRWATDDSVRELNRESRQFFALLRVRDFERIWPASQSRPVILGQSGELLLVKNAH